MVGCSVWRFLPLLALQADLLGLLAVAADQPSCADAANETLCQLAQTLWDREWAAAQEQGNASINESESHSGTMAATGDRQSRGRTAVSVQSTAPNDFTRDLTYYDWCDCGTGLEGVTIWPNSDWNRRVTVTKDTIKYVHFGIKVLRVRWICDGMDSSGSSWLHRWRDLHIPKENWVSLVFSSETKDVGKCSEMSGRLHWNTWAPVSYAASVPFVSGTEGYPCFKIPAMLVTQSGAVLAFSEARTPNCDDFARTDLVFKRSTDGGKTWSSLKQVVEVPGNSRALGECGNDLVVGNAAPVQLRKNSTSHPGRILLPYTRNNFEIWMTYSDDDGVTWTGDHKIPNVTDTAAAPDCNRSMSYFGINAAEFSFANARAITEWIVDLCKQRSPFDNPDWVAKLSGPWQFIGTGPPGSLQLRSGRVLVPSYRSYVRGITVSQLYNNFGLGFVLISDDDGDTWRLGQEWTVSNGADENQMVELPDGSVLMNSRSLATGSPQMRLQARSTDQGETFSPSTFVPELPQPFNGCQGSTLKGRGSDVYVTTPDPDFPTSIAQKLVDEIGCTIRLDGRSQLTAWKSTDGGRTYPEKKLIDPGLAAQTSLQIADGRLVVLHEQADPLPRTPENLFQEALLQNLRVLTPTRFIFREFAVSSKGGRTHAEKPKEKFEQATLAAAAAAAAAAPPPRRAGVLTTGVCGLAVVAMASLGASLIARRLRGQYRAANADEESLHQVLATGAEANALEMAAKEEVLVE